MSRLFWMLLALFTLTTLLPSPALAAEAVIKLMDAGAQKKRSPLRQSPKKGSSETLEMGIDMRMKMSMAGMALGDMTLPHMRMVVRADVLDVAKDGTITYDFEMTAADAAGKPGDPTGEAMNAELGKMVGVKGRAKVSASGRPLQSDLTAAPSLDPAMVENLRKSMRQAAAPLPEEPVGLGAVWTVTQDVADQGLAMRQVATYKLVERTKTTAKLEVSIVQTADPQKMEPKGMPPGSEANLAKLDSSGGGFVMMRLDRVFPESSSLKQDMEMSMDVTAQGQQMGMQMSMNMTMTAKGTSVK